MDRVFGHREMYFFFKPFLELQANGFKFKNKEYTWSDITFMETHNPRHNFLAQAYFWPLTYVYLNDGKRVYLNARILEEVGRKPKTGFWSRSTDAYEELKSLFEEKTSVKF